MFMPSQGCLPPAAVTLAVADHDSNGNERYLGLEYGVWASLFGYISLIREQLSRCSQG